MKDIEAQLRAAGWAAQEPKCRINLAKFFEMLALHPNPAYIAKVRHHLYNGVHYHYRGKWPSDTIRVPNARGLQDDPIMMAAGDKYFAEAAAAGILKGPYPPDALPEHLRRCIIHLVIVANAHPKPWAIV
jgi:hypothetical protein